MNAGSRLILLGFVIFAKALCGFVVAVAPGIMDADQIGALLVIVTCP